MKKLSIISALLLTASVNVNAAELLVDNFNGTDKGKLETDMVNVLKEATQTQSGGGSQILGLHRDLGAIRVNGSNDPDSNTNNVNVFTDPDDATNGLFSFSNDAQIRGTGTLQYDGDNDGGVSSRSYDLGEDISGFTVMEALFLTADLGFQFEVGLYTSAGQYSTFIADLPSGPGLQTLNLSLFTGCVNAAITCVGGGVDLSQLNAIDIIFRSGDTPDLDLTLDNIKFTVPAPSTLAMLGLGLLSFGFISRRKVKASLQA